MIYFQTKPDVVFEAILQEALVSEMTEVRMVADDAAIDSWEGLYPETSTFCGPYKAVRLMAQLLAAIRDASVYQLTDIHWLLLYECLRNFCATHNDLVEDDPQALRPIGTFQIGFLDGTAIVDIYFWDTDFLLRPIRGDWKNIECDVLREENIEVQTQDLSVDSIEDDVPLLEMVDEVAWIVPEPSAFFRAGSTQYPDTRG
ncbi:hypothetical protein [Candidatus Nitronereus thalassa]|uniref:Uncharacterized protein n=1 Tax=Candidatus Nitronereus thalassa TaxID=3020898 RepID=A0ABU3KCQ6_9BACT|nr:hypothetical protein [Candidatus Nitronereus thalassa]MDT7044226.1 hypothetical protein [Candidatus Nitronereus thalassa]